MAKMANLEKIARNTVGPEQSRTALIVMKANDLSHEWEELKKQYPQVTSTLSGKLIDNELNRNYGQ